LATPAAAGIIASEVARGGGASVPLARPGSPDELADLKAWLQSDQAARVTGPVWPMYAGFSTIRPLVK
jgi:NAD(P)-dependent dehydrogenase (short-subunit alcohol dehydrogenase family)